MIKKYRKKPVEIEAVIWDGDNVEEIEAFCNGAAKFTPVFCSERKRGAYIYDLKIKTLEGNMTARTNDYIIKGVNGEFYPCKPDIFEKTYEVVE